jgi:hypothetical protein
MSDYKITYRQIAGVSVHKCMARIAVKFSVNGLSRHPVVTCRISQFVYRILAMITGGFFGSVST